MSEVVARVSLVCLSAACVAVFLPGCGAGVQPGTDVVADSFEDHGQGDAAGELPSDIPADDQFSPDADAMDADTAQDVPAADEGDAPDTETVAPADFRVIDLSDVGDINAMWGDANLSTWAVGNGGLVLVRRKGDFVYAPRPPSTADFRGITGVGDAIWVVGSGGTVLRYSGGLWEDLQSPVTTDLNAISCPSADECFAVGAGGTIVHWFDGVWDIQDSGVAWDLFGVLSEVNGGTWVVGNFGSLFELSGSDWLSSQIAGTRSSMKSIFRAADGTLFAVGSMGTIVSRAAGSTLWQQQISNDGHDPQRDLYSVTGTSSTDVWAVGDSGAIIHWDGAYWKMSDVVGPGAAYADFRTVAVSGDGAVFAAGRVSAMVSFNPEEGTWVDVAAGPSTDLNGVWVEKSSGSGAGADDSVVFVGENGLMMEYSSHGFGLVESGLATSIMAIDGGVAVGRGGVVLAVGGGGETPRTVTRVISSTVEDLVDVFADDQGWVMAGAAGTVFSMNDAMAPSYLAQVSGRLTSVCRTPAGIFVGGEAGLVALLPASDGEEATFRDVVTFTQSAVRDLAPMPDGRVLAVGDNGVMMVCGTLQCDRIHEDPASFIYGVASLGIDGVVDMYAVGWAGVALHYDGVNVTPVDSGTHAVFNSADSVPGGTRVFVAGRRGTVAIFTPDADR